MYWKNIVRILILALLLPVQGITDNTCNRDTLVAEARKYQGVSYRYGGTGPDGFDCSGFTQFVYSYCDISLPRSSVDQYTAGRAVQESDARPGDLVFFKINYRRVSHVGIYLGDGQFIHAPSPGKKVSIASIGVNYWKSRLAGFRDVIKD